MRPSILALTASGYLASAHWAKWGGSPEAIAPPAETATSNPDNANGWTLKPTDAPGKAGAKVALDLLKRDTPNTWLNAKTCGWFADTMSAPWTCDSGSSCATDTNNVIGCAAGTSSSFMKACYDFAAFQSGACDAVGPNTGCCQTSQFGACATYLWPGNPSPSMYRCMEQATVITMRNDPKLPIPTQTITHIETLLTTVTPPEPTTTTTINTVTTTITPSPDTELKSRDAGDGGNGRERIGLIIGCVLGGIVGVICIFFVIIFIVLRRDPTWRHNMYAKKEGAAPSPPPVYAAEDPELAAQGPPPQVFEMQPVSGRGGGANSGV